MSLVSIVSDRDDEVHCFEAELYRVSWRDRGKYCHFNIIGPPSGFTRLIRVPKKEALRFMEEHDIDESFDHYLDEKRSVIAIYMNRWLRALTVREALLRRE